MTRQEQQARDKRYADWHEAYVEEVRDRVKHWGDKRAGRTITARKRSGLGSGLDGALLAPGGQHE